MPICPNCGSYIPLGNHSCECGTTIGYDDDSDYSSGGSEKQRILHENPYDEDFFNELYHNDISPFSINRMVEGVRELEDKFSAKLDDASFHNGAVYFALKHENEYYGATLRAYFDLSDPFRGVVLFNDIVTPDFSRLYSNEEFRKVIFEKEKEKNSKFHYCRLLIIDGVLMVSAVFDERGYIVDFDDDMTLIE